MVCRVACGGAWVELDEADIRLLTRAAHAPAGIEPSDLQQVAYRARRAGRSSPGGKNSLVGAVNGRLDRERLQATSLIR